MDGTAQETVMVAPSVGNRVVTTRDTQFHLDFNFSCDLFVNECYGSEILRSTVSLGVMGRSVSMGLNQLMSYECSHGMIQEELRDWPVADDDRRDLSEFAINAAKDLIRLMPPQHNVLVIPLNVIVVCDRRLHGNHLAMQLMERLSTIEAGSCMVPATDSSIESLEIKTITSCGIVDESCSICLEDFSIGGEVASMPCSHIFHENCVKEWLRSSHSCPICRFEMPTS